MTVRTWVETGETCPTCDGLGYDAETVDGGYGDDGMQQRAAECEDCDGSGRELVEVVGETERLAGVAK